MQAGLPFLFCATEDVLHSVGRNEGGISPSSGVHTAGKVTVVGVV